MTYFKVLFLNNIRDRYNDTKHLHIPPILNDIRTKDMHINTLPNI